VIPRKLAAETLGTAFLLATVIGSGIMGERIAGGNVALALLCNTLPTGAILVVLITMLAPISGAHLNPAVTLALFLRREIAARNAIAYASVGLYIVAAYWFTASTSFANPAVTIARAFSDTFAGIRPNDVALFIFAQCLGAVCALGCFRLLVDSSLPAASAKATTSEAEQG
jgi:glycerol uptake facilitator-like aquaporin